MPRAGAAGGAVAEQLSGGVWGEADQHDAGDDSLAAVNDQVFLGGGVVTASSGDNFLAQTGANGAVSYTLLFTNGYASVSWVRPRLLAGTTGAVAAGVAGA